MDKLEGCTTLLFLPWHMCSTSPHSVFYFGGFALNNFAFCLKWFFFPVITFFIKNHSVESITYNLLFLNTADDRCSYFFCHHLDSLMLCWCKHKFYRSEVCYIRLVGQYSGSLFRCDPSVLSITYLYSQRMYWDTTESLGEAFSHFVINLLKEQNCKTEC